MDNISKFEEDILKALLAGDQYEQQLLNQLSFLQVINYEYTGVGVYIDFNADAIEEIHRIPEKSYILDGVEIQSTELELGASAIIFITDGALDFLEIWGHSDHYPRHELSHYTLLMAGS